MPSPSQERPIFLVVPGRTRVAEAFRAVLSQEEVSAWTMPALWDLRWDGVNALEALRDVRHVDLETVDVVVKYLLAAATPEALKQNVARAWGEAGNRVREFFLRRSTWSIVGTIFRVGKPTASYAPTPEFASDCVHEARFEAAYRLHTVPGAAANPSAPAEEASLVFYPFDPENAAGRPEAGLAANGREVVLEAFAYDAGRARHRAHLQSVANANGWRVVDPSGS